MLLALASRNSRREGGGGSARRPTWARLPRAGALNRASVFAGRGEADVSRDLNGESGARAAGDREAEVTALHDLAGAYGRIGLLRESIERYEAVLVLFESMGDVSGVVVALANIGVAHRRLGELGCAQERHREAVRRARQLGNHHYLAISLCELGVSELESSNRPEARRLLEAALRCARDAGDLVLAPWILWSLMAEACRAGSARKAARLAGAAARAAQEVGFELEPTDAAWVEKHIQQAHSALAESEFDAERDAGTGMSLEDTVAYVSQVKDAGDLRRPSSVDT
jgi:tetratricopeptide (TPR) repeat protein